MKSFIYSLFILCIAFTACDQTNKNGQWINLNQWEELSENQIGEIVLSDSGTFSLCQTELNNNTYKNFEFSAEVFTTDDASAGVWFNTDDTDKGYEVLINNTYNAKDRRKTGSLATVRNLYKSMAKNNEWFLMSILVQDKTIEVKINDTTVVRYTEPENPYRIPENSAQLLGDGTFALASYGGIAKFKNIQLRALATDVVADAPQVIDEQTDEIIRLQQANYPVIDYHVHLKGWSTMQAHENSMKVGINYGIAPNCGIGFPVTNDQQVYDYIDSTKHMPFFFAMQGEGREWVTTFSKEAMQQFDYVFTDALTFTDHKGRRTRLWIDEEVFIDVDHQQYMDLIVDKIVDVIRDEPINIYVNPCFLPTEMEKDYDALWTPARMQRVVNALKEKGVALEINARYRIPNAATIKLAKQAGIKLAFGTNNGDPNIGKLEYCIEMIKECNITPDDLYFPEMK